jgi:hypothetical protein
LFLSGLCQVVIDREGELLPEHVVATQPYTSVAGAEPAKQIREPEVTEEFVAQHPVTDVVRVVKIAGRAEQTVDADVVK